MRALIAGSTILTLTLSSLAPLGVAQAAPTAPIPAATVVKTVRVDVDGNGKKDLVQLFHHGGNIFRLQVTTDKVTASDEFLSALPADGDWSNNLIWYGAASLDGTKGAELIVHTYDADSWENWDTPSRLGVYTWRSGHLVEATAPKAPKTQGWHLGTSDPYGINGYRFFTKSGRRYVEVADLVDRPGNNHWSGKILRSVWKKRAWVKVSTRTVKLGEKSAGRYQTINGPSILLGQARADIDGDGRADAMTYRRLADDNIGSLGTWTLAVKTAKGIRRVIRLSPNSGDPLLGVAALDGVRGSEIIFTVDNESPLWKVYTWRKGKLVKESGPNMCGDSSKVWQGCGDESSTGLDFSVVGSQHYLIVSSASPGESHDVSYTKYLWRSGKWVKQSSWSAQLSEADFAKRCSGFCGVALIDF